MTASGLTFSDRLRLRRQLWWDRRTNWAEPSSLVAAWHAHRELSRRRSRDEPIDIWRCCPQWPRSLLNKWNGREFAAKHGVRPPEIYSYSRRGRRLPLAALPERFVLRPLRGTNDLGVVVAVDGRELIRDIACRKADTTALVVRGHGGCLVEEFISRPDGTSRLPIEYKCHTFAGRVAAIQVVERVERRPPRSVHRFYAADWRPFDDPMARLNALADPIPPPPFLDDLVGAAQRMGAVINSYMRIDFLAGTEGPVFDEFSSVPAERKSLTPYGDAFLGACWDEACGEAP